MRTLTLLLFAGLTFAQTAPSYKQLVYPPLKPVKIPEPVQFTLANGMRVFLLEDHELPLVSGLALVRTGNLFDPSDKRGLSSVMADVLRSGGTRAKTGDQIDEELETSPRPSNRAWARPAPASVFPASRRPPIPCCGSSRR
jgi:zinc protease